MHIIRTYTTLFLRTEAYQKKTLHRWRRTCRPSGIPTHGRYWLWYRSGYLLEVRWQPHLRGLRPDCRALPRVGDVSAIILTIFFLLGKYIFLLYFIFLNSVLRNIGNVQFSLGEYLRSRSLIRFNLWDVFLDVKISKKPQ